jgi:hypothetical protein
MELVLEQEEIEVLVREALAARGTKIDHLDVVKVRRNNKRGTVRLIFKTG